jgi:hypothetical protein
VKQDGLKFNGRHQILVYGGVSVLDGNVHTVKNNTAASLVASKETGIEENADKPKYMVTSRDQNAGRSHSMKIDSSSFERVEQFEYLGTTCILCNNEMQLTQCSLLLSALYVFREVFPPIIRSL